MLVMETRRDLLGSVIVSLKEEVEDPVPGQSPIRVCEFAVRPLVVMKAPSAEGPGFLYRVGSQASRPALLESLMAETGSGVQGALVVLAIAWQMAGVSPLRENWKLCLSLAYLCHVVVDSVAHDDNPLTDRLVPAASVWEHAVSRGLLLLGTSSGSVAVVPL